MGYSVSVGYSACWRGWASGGLCCLLIGLACHKRISVQDLERLKQRLRDFFGEYNLEITAEMGLQRVNFLDVTFDMMTNTYEPYRKPNDNPMYINKDSNHPKHVIRNIPLSINKRLTEISSSKLLFDSSKGIYQNALNQSGYTFTLKYQSKTNESQNQSTNGTDRRSPTPANTPSTQRSLNTPPQSNHRSTRRHPPATDSTPRAVPSPSPLPNSTPSHTNPPTPDQTRNQLTSQNNRDLPGSQSISQHRQTASPRPPPSAAPSETKLTQASQNNDRPPTPPDRITQPRRSQRLRDKAQATSRNAAPTPREPSPSNPDPTPLTQQQPTETNAPTTNQSEKKNRNKDKNFLYYNPPWDASLSTNLGQKFLQLLDKHFPKSHILYPIMNRKKYKLAYRVSPSKKAIISSHNKRILNKTKPKPPPLPCNCQKECHMPGECRIKSVIYQASIADVTYVGVT